MNPRHTFYSFVLASGLICGSSLFAQAPRIDFPAPSPGCTLKQRVGITDIEIVYSRPSAKGRKVFGNVVPFGQVWRTGANASTKISFSTQVKLNSVEVPAGKYALYTIPDETEWTMILSKDLNAGAFNYDSKSDLVRFKAKPFTLEDTTLETFTIEFNHIRDDSAALNLVWKKTVVPIMLKLDLTGSFCRKSKKSCPRPAIRSPISRPLRFIMTTTRI